MANSIRRYGAVFVAALALAGSGVYALKSYGALTRLREERDRAAERINAAALLAREHPAAFGPASRPLGDSPMKAVVQESGAKHGLAIAFLSEDERETPKGRERQVHVRLSNALHPPFIRFLLDVENSIRGAQVKEIHLRPSRVANDTYEEADIVVAKSTAEVKP